MKTALYFNVGKKIETMLFSRNDAPLGWIRSDLLLTKLKEPDYKNKFSKEEINYIMGKVNA